MAVGDVVGNVLNIAAAATGDFQPAGEVEIMITGVGSNFVTGVAPVGRPDMSIFIVSATIPCLLWSIAHYIEMLVPMKLFISNTFWLRLQNTGLATTYLYYNGIQTK